MQRQRSTALSEPGLEPGAHAEEELDQRPWSTVFPAGVPSDDDSDACASFIHRRLNRPARVLDLGCGSGRIARRLARLGHRVTAVDFDTDAIQALHSANVEGVTAVQADMLEFDGQHQFDAVICVHNTICCLLTVEEQRALLQTCARSVAHDGFVTVESILPNPALMRPALQSIPRVLNEQFTIIQNTQVDVLAQRIYRHDLVHETRSDGTSDTRVHRLDMRYVWPAELETMALLADLPRTALYDSFVNLNPLNSGAMRYVSIFEPTSAG